MNIVKELIERVVRKHYEPINNPKDVIACDGAQMWQTKWWMPLSGCDTLQNLIDDLEFEIQHFIK